jgi:hypothetical protein
LRRVSVEGTDEAGKPVSKDFEVLRFGLHCPKANTAPTVVGLADAQTHVIKAWLPHYRVHSAQSLEVGAWQVYQNFLIHDGPDDTVNEVYATIGCIEICGAPRGFDTFNDFLIGLSGSKSTRRTGQLAEIGKARNMAIGYLKAKRPTVTPAR